MRRGLMGLLALFCSVLTGFSTAQASDCPANWNITLASPQQLADNYHVPLLLSPNFTMGPLTKVDSNGNLSQKLSLLSLNDYTFNLSVQYSLDNKSWTDAPVLNGVSQVDTWNGSYLRLALSIITSSCRSPYTIFSAPSTVSKAVIASVPLSSLDESIKYFPLQERISIENSYPSCKSSVINLLTTKSTTPWELSPGCDPGNHGQCDKAGVYNCGLTFLIQDNQKKLINISELPKSYIHDHPQLSVIAIEKVIDEASWNGWTPSSIPTLVNYQVDSFTVNSFHLSTSNPAGAVGASTVKQIVCLKGKSKLTVSGANPKCPVGYKTQGK